MILIVVILFWNSSYFFVLHILICIKTNPYIFRKVQSIKTIKHLLIMKIIGQFN